MQKPMLIQAFLSFNARVKKVYNIILFKLPNNSQNKSNN